MIKLKNEILFYLRVKNQYTVKQVAELSGLNYTLYSDLENGRKNLGIKTAWSLADLYDISIDEIVGRVPLQ